MCMKSLSSCLHKIKINVINFFQKQCEKKWNKYINTWKSTVFFGFYKREKGGGGKKKKRQCYELH
jgi:uncharacterized protein YdeI (YjbR/CyaY-like superfamily)